MLNSNSPLIRNNDCFGDHKLLLSLNPPNERQSSFLISHSAFGFFVAGNSKQNTYTAKASSSIIIIVGGLSAFRLSGLTKMSDQTATKINKFDFNSFSVSIYSLFAIGRIVWCLHSFLQMSAISAEKKAILHILGLVKGLMCAISHWMSSASAKANIERIIIMEHRHIEMSHNPPVSSCTHIRKTRFIFGFIFLFRNAMHL